MHRLLLAVRCFDGAAVGAISLCMALTASGCRLRRTTALGNELTQFVVDALAPTIPCTWISR